MILRTYARVPVESLEESVAAFELLTGEAPHLRFAVADVDLVAVGDFLLVGGNHETLGPLLHAIGPVVVDDLDAAISQLLDGGGQIVMPAGDSPTGRFAYVKQRDGSVIELVQWTDDLVARHGRR